MKLLSFACTRTIIAVSIILPLLASGKLPERDELFTRSYNGTYNITSTVDCVVTGGGMLDLLICIPYPESNRYQDIVWRKEIPEELIAYYPETGHPYIRYAKFANDQSHVNIERDFVVSLYKVKFDWSAVTEIYPYDTEDEDYKIYTRKYPADGDGYDTAYEWILQQRDAICSQCGGDVLGFIRGAYLTVATNFTYGSSSSVADSLARKIGDCGRGWFWLTSIFKSKCIPTRKMVCLRPDGSAHVWAEFYLQNYGWIPADVNSDLKSTDHLQRFGVYKDSCIVMTYDGGFNMVTTSGHSISNVSVQTIAWWYFWSGGNPYGTERRVTKTMSFGSIHGKIDTNGMFTSSDKMWEKWMSQGVYEHSVFEFDINLSNKNNGGYVIGNGGSCSYQPSPVGSAICLDAANAGPWTTAELDLPEEWTILTMLRSVDLDNGSLFCVGSAREDQCGFALASGGKDRVTLSYWEDGMPHVDLIRTDVPCATDKYHAYAIRCRGKAVELFVDGTKAGDGVLGRIPNYGLQFLGIILGKRNTGLDVPIGACIDDWRLCHSALSDAAIEAYASILGKYDEDGAFVNVANYHVPYYWVSRHYPGTTKFDEVATGCSASGKPVWESYLTGTDPTDSQSVFSVQIAITNEMPVISWSPDLNTNGIMRTYTIWGSTNLKENVWHSPTNNESRFFKVIVDMP